MPRVKCEQCTAISPYTGYRCKRRASCHKHCPTRCYQHASHYNKAGGCAHGYKTLPARLPRGKKTPLNIEPALQRRAAPPAVPAGPPRLAWEIRKAIKAKQPVTAAERAQLADFDRQATEAKRRAWLSVHGDDELFEQRYPQYKKVAAAEEKKAPNLPLGQLLQLPGAKPHRQTPGRVAGFAGKEARRKMMHPRGVEDIAFAWHRRR